MVKMKEQLARDCTLTVHLSGENTGPDTQLIETTLMYISRYPFKFSAICSHCIGLITASLMLTWKGRQCYIFLPAFHIFLRTLLFTRVDAHPEKAYGGPAIILMGSFISERKIYTEKENLNPTDKAFIRAYPSINNLSLPSCVFPGILKLIPNLLLNYSPFIYITVAMHILTLQGTIHPHVTLLDPKCLTVK